MRVGVASEPDVGGVARVTAVAVTGADVAAGLAGGAVGGLAWVAVATACLGAGSVAVGGGTALLVGTTVG